MSRAEWSCGLCAVLATALTIVPAIVLAIVPAIVLAVVPATVLAIVLAHVLALVLATVLAIVLASLLAIVLASVLTIVLALVHRTRFVSVLENRCVVKLISFQQQGPQPSLPGWLRSLTRGPPRGAPGGEIPCPVFLVVLGPRSWGSFSGSSSRDRHSSYGVYRTTRPVPQEVLLGWKTPGTRDALPATDPSRGGLSGISA